MNAPPAQRRAAGAARLKSTFSCTTVYDQATQAATNLSESTEALKHNFLVRGFFKNRGYENAGDLTKYQIAKLPVGPSVKTFSYEGKQIFDKPDTAKLQNEKVLNEAGKSLKKTTFCLVVVACDRRYEGRFGKGSSANGGPGHGG